MNPLLLHDLGYRLIFMPSGKGPKVDGWPEKQLSREEVVELLPRVIEGSANVGTILAADSGPQGILDIEWDDSEGQQQWRELWEGVEIPVHPFYHSPRSQHNLFAHEPRLAHLTRSAKHWNGATGLELRLGPSAHSVIPPSIDREWDHWCEPPRLPSSIVDRILAHFNRPARVQPLQPEVRDWFDTVCDDPQLREKALSALQSCKCYDSYGDWRAVGMAIHSIDPELYSFWDEWSRQSSKYRDGETQREWNKFGPGTITAGTLFHLAKQDGWEWEPPTPEPEPMTEPTEPEWKKYFPISRLEGEIEPRTYLVDGFLVEGEPCIIGGGMKTLKTSVAMDMALSIRSGQKFLGEFAVTQPDQEFDVLPTILFMSAESGKETLTDLRLRICAAKRLDPDSERAQIEYCAVVPKFTNKKLMDYFRQCLDEITPDVLIVDPAYIAMPSDGSASLSINGEALYEMINTARERNITFILLAHFKKNTGASKTKPPTLEDLCGAGYAEAARQWILLKRMTGYKNDGHHELHVMAGGSAGHDGLYTLHIDEGKRPKEPSDPPRRWEINKIVLKEDDTDSAERQDYIDDGDKIIVLLRKSSPLTLTQVAKSMRMSKQSESVKQHLDRLIEQGRVESFKSKSGKAKKESDYYRLTQAEIEAAIVDLSSQGAV